MIENTIRIAGIPHQDILNIWGNPYIGVVTKWNTLSERRRQDILKDYPETDRIAWNFSNAKRELALEISRSNEDWGGLTKDFLSDLIIFGTSAAAEWWVGKTCPPVHAYAMPAMVNSGARIAARISPKLAKIDYKLNILYKKAEDFFKKKINTGTKLRVGTSGYKLGKHWNNLKPVNTPEMQRQIGKINKKAFGGGEIRTDGKCIYR